MKNLKFNDIINWNKIDKNDYPQVLKNVYISDGEIVDCGFRMAGNWYMFNYHEIMGEVKYWRYMQNKD